MRNARVLFVLLLVISGSSCLGQLNNRVFEDRLSVEPSDSGKFFLGLNALGFFKNNEYFGAIINGYTLFGFQLQPTLSYHLNPNIRIDAGFYLQKDFGNENLSTTAPIFSIKWRSKEYSAIFGNLEGSLNHRLIEPLYDFERVLNHRLESGVQFQINREDLFLDTWIDWQFMDYQGAKQQEQLVGGISVQKRVAKVGTGSLSIPLQVVSRHQGGQLNAVNQPIQTLVNSAVGLNWAQPTNGFITGLNLNAFYCYDKDITLTRQAYIDGDAVYVNGTLSTRLGLDVMASYWQGREFMSIQGGKIYPSVSPQDPRVVQPKAQILIIRFLYDLKITDQLYLTLRCEPYYDLSFKNFEYSYAFYLNYRDRFFLTRRGK